MHRMTLQVGNVPRQILWLEKFQNQHPAATMKFSSARVQSNAKNGVVLTFKRDQVLDMIRRSDLRFTLLEEPMPQPLVVSLPHKLGKDEARRRLQSGMQKAATQFGSVVTVDEEIWSGDRLTFAVTAMRQKVRGTLDVYDDRVQLEVVLPWLLAGIAHSIQGVIRERGKRLLEKK